MTWLGRRGMKTSSLRHLDLFSGIGGFSLGFGRAGFTTVGLSEIDPFCCAVLRKHWPAVPVTSGRPIGGGESGSSAGWTTPTEFDATSSQPAKLRPSRIATGRKTDYLSRQVQWSTARAEDSEQTGAHAGVPDTLTSAARMFPTPQVFDAKDCTRSPEKRLEAKQRGGCANLREVIHDGPLVPGKLSTNGKPCGCLNSRWVASLMGFPSDWCDLPTKALSELMAIASSRKSRKPSGGQL